MFWMFHIIPECPNCGEWARLAVAVRFSGSPVWLWRAHRYRHYDAVSFSGSPVWLWCAHCYRYYDADDF